MADERDQHIADPAEWNRLIAAIAECRDRDAFAQLFGYFAPRIKTYMLRRGSTDSGAEELAQETMLAVWRKADLYDPRAANAATWIFTIARNLRIDAHRREHGGWMGGNYEVEAEFRVDEAPLPDQQIASSQAEERVRAALTRLPPDQLRVVELSFFEERAHADIARTLGMPLGTVKSRLRLAMARLRDLLRDMS